MPASIIATMQGVREYAEGYPIELRRDADNGRLVIRAVNQGGHDVTHVDLVDLLDWLEPRKATLGIAARAESGVGGTEPEIEASEHGKKMMRDALSVLARVHTRDDDVTGFVFCVGATPQNNAPGISAAEHIQAWAVVRAYLGMASSAPLREGRAG